MALLFVDSFDHYATADITEKWGNALNTPTIVAAAGRRSSAGLRTATSQAVVTRSLPVSGSVAIIGVAFKPSTLATPRHLITVRTGGTLQVSLVSNASGQLLVYRGSASGTLLGTATGSISVGTYYYIELKTTLHASAGTAVVRVNGAEVLNLSGVNTANSGTAWDNVAAPDNPSNQAAAGDWDDLYICDGSGAAPWNDFLGDIRVDVRYPTAEGAASQWTPSTGTDNALLLDETAPNDDTDYNSTSTVGQKDTHVVQDAPVVGAAILGVQVNLSAKKSDAGACSLAPVIRHSGTDYQGTAQNPGTAYAYLIQTYQANPGTSAQWTEAQFNACEVGYIRTA